MKSVIKVHGIKIQPKFDFKVCRSNFKGYSLLNMQNTQIWFPLYNFSNI